MTESTDSTVLRIEQFAESYRTLDDAQFRAKHGDAFLIHYGALDQLRRPPRPRPTVDFDFKDETPFFSGSPLHLLKSDYLVYPVVWTGRSPYPRMITVGRTRNNDIVLPDESVSKFHAFFRESRTVESEPEPGVLFLQDAGSRNGTQIEGRVVPVARQGDPASVGPGARIRFGLVELTFLDAGGLRELVKHLRP
jgi:hypothetical protein